MQIISALYYSVNASNRTLENTNVHVHMNTDTNVFILCVVGGPDLEHCEGQGGPHHFLHHAGPPPG